MNANIDVPVSWRELINFAMPQAFALWDPVFETCPSGQSMTSPDPQSTLPDPQIPVPENAALSPPPSVSLTIGDHVFIDDSHFVEIDLSDEEEDTSDRSFVRSFFSRVFSFFKSVFSGRKMDA